MDRNSLRRVLSNLLDNAFQAVAQEDARDAGRPPVSVRTCFSVRIPLWLAAEGMEPKD